MNGKDDGEEAMIRRSHAGRRPLSGLLPAPVEPATTLLLPAGPARRVVAFPAPGRPARRVRVESRTVEPSRAVLIDLSSRRGGRCGPATSLRGKA